MCVLIFLEGKGWQELWKDRAAVDRFAAMMFEILWATLLTHSPEIHCLRDNEL